MRIGLNLLHAMPAIGGAWNYIARLVGALGEYGGDNRYVAFVTDTSRSIVPRQSNFEIVRVRLNPSFRPQRVLYENTSLQLNAMRHRLDLMHWFANTLAIANSVPGVVTVYDLQVFDNPSTFPSSQRIYLHTMLPHAVRSAAMLLPMSHTTAHSLESILKARPDHIQVIPAIATTSFQPIDPARVCALRQAHGLPTHFWLYVAHFYPHKNHARLLQAYYELKSSGMAPWPLVLRGDDCGTLEEVRRFVIRMHMEDDVRFLPPVREDELPTLYSAASALIFPSTYEGGGLPLVEAMACGCPVTASNIEVVREVGGDAIFRFDHGNSESIAAAMRIFQRDAVMRAEARRVGLGQILVNRPEQVIGELTGAYQRALSRRPAGAPAPG